MKVVIQSMHEGEEPTLHAFMSIVLEADAPSSSTMLDVLSIKQRCRQHVPGEEHTRCDGLSRGEQPMAARLPLTAAWFDHITQIAGPWDEIIGRECKYASKPFTGADTSIASKRSYIHPRVGEVATTLLWILAAVKQDWARTAGVVVVQQSC